MSTPYADPLTEPTAEANYCAKHAHTHIHTKDKQQSHELKAALTSSDPAGGVCKQKESDILSDLIEPRLTLN